MAKEVHRKVASSNNPQKAKGIIPALVINVKTKLFCLVNDLLSVTTAESIPVFITSITDNN
jgi:hypothetical protein